MVAARFCGILMWAIGVAVGGGAFAQDEEEASKARLKVMERTIAGFEVSSDAIQDKATLTFKTQPLLRYSDPTRGLADAVLLDASVWRLGERGRPTGLVTLEIYRAGDKMALLSYEFASLTDAKFSLRHKEHKKVAWDASGSALQVQPLDGAPAPAASAAGRLSQMRQQARRFQVSEKLLNLDVVECRLLTQPIDRYQPAPGKISDGAIFAFANGTNPELGLVLECDDKGWSYGAVRLSAAESTLELDGRQVARFPSGDFGSQSGVYASNNHPLALPQ